MMKLVKLNHSTLVLLADCIKEARAMVSQGYTHPVFLCFFFFNVAKNEIKAYAKATLGTPKLMLLIFLMLGEYLGNLRFAC